MAVITVLRQAGCGGLYIAKKVAETLNYQFSGYEMMQRILKTCGYQQVEEVYESVPSFWDRFTRDGPDRDVVAETVRAVVLAQAKRGDVVMLGRANFAPLQGLSDVLNVRIKAPMPLRIRRVMHDLQLRYDDALAHIEERDRLLDDFASSSYGVSPHELGLFDLVIDTGKVDHDTVVSWMVQAARALPRPEDDAPRASLLQIDPKVAQAVSLEYERDATTPTRPAPEDAE